MLELFTLPPSPHNTKVHLALKLKGLEYSSREVHGFDGREEIVARTGQPLTPVLMDEGKAVLDSFGIVRYLDANWPEPRLFRPTREAMRAIEAWERLTLDELAGNVGAILNQLFTGEDAEVTARANAKIEAAARKVEDALATRDYLVDEQLSAADITVAPFLRFSAQSADLYEAGTPAHFVAARADLDASFERTRAWIARVFAIESAPAT